MTYEEAREALARIAGRGNCLGLERMRALLKELGNPQDDLVYIHIAGTNGKGSVMAFLEQILLDSGYRAGRYFSPAVFCYEERIRSCGRNIAKAEIAHYTEVILEAMDRLAQRGEDLPTIFEVETAMAFLFFRDQGCSPVLLETGMGGRDDATNVVRTTQLCIFSAISLDHMEYLGSTVREIAGIKADILKPGARAVSDAQIPEVMEVLEDACRKTGCPLKNVSVEEIVPEAEGLDGQVFSYGNHAHVRISLAGKHQLRNAALALEAVDELREIGYTVPEECVRSGMARTRWPGRFEVYRLGREDPGADAGAGRRTDDSPADTGRPDGGIAAEGGTTGADAGRVVIMDGAHNPDAAHQLRLSLEDLLPGKKLCLIFGVFRDKDRAGIIREMIPLAGRIYTIQARYNERALPAEELRDAILDQFPEARVTAVGDAAEAIALALEETGPDVPVVIFGSLAFLPEAAEALRGIGGV